MAKEAQATGFVKGGRLTIRQTAWPLPDGEVTVMVRKVTATRSIPQNRWYWGQVVKLVADHTGYTPDEVHEIYKAKFLPRLVELPGEGGEIVAELTIGGTTTTLDTEEFSAYCEMIREWAFAMLHVSIPDPE